MYLKNFSWLFVEKIIRISGGIFIGIWIARYLGPNDYGVLNYALAYIGFFQLFRQACSWSSLLAAPLIGACLTYPRGG